MPVAIVYGEESGIIRRFVHADRIEELSGHYGKGESIIILDANEIEKKGKPDLYSGIKLVAEKRGKPAEEARCLVINHDSGEIETVIQADPILDTLPAKTLYQHADAAPGWKLDDKGEYVAPAVVAEPVAESAVDVKPIALVRD